MWLNYVFPLGGILSVLPLICGAWLVWDYETSTDEPETGDLASRQYSPGDARQARTSGAPLRSGRPA